MGWVVGVIVIVIGAFIVYTLIQVLRARKRALSMEMKLSHKGLIKDGKVIASTEKEIFEALGLSYVPPEQRE